MPTTKKRVYSLTENGEVVFTGTPHEIQEKYSIDPSGLSYYYRKRTKLFKKYQVDLVGYKEVPIEKKPKEKVKTELERIIEHLDYYGNTICEKKYLKQLEEKGIKVYAKQSIYDKRFYIICQA